MNSTVTARYLLKDFFIIVISICFAIVLVKTQVLHSLLVTTQEFQFIGSLIAGLFFTSVFTTAPAIVALGEISQVSSILSVAFFGAIGSVIGDLVIFTFIRDRFSDHLLALLRDRREGKRVTLKNNFIVFKWFSFFIGCLIIASPLPDELGIGLMGFSKVNMKLFIPISFTFNFIGIVLIGIVANSI